MKKMYPILTASILLISSSLFGQALKNAGTIYVQSNGTNHGLLYVDGDVEITSTATMTVDGIMEVKGNFANNRTDGTVAFGGTGAGLVKFSGTGTLQTVSTTSGNGNVVFQNLETSNPVTTFIAGVPADGVSMLDNLVVNGTLTFNNGDIGAMTHNITIGLNGTCAGYTSVYNGVFTSGSFIKKVSSGTLGSFTLPYYKEDGNTTYGDGYLPVSINLDAAPGAANQIKVKFIPNATIGNVFKVFSCTNIAGTPVGNQNVMISKMVEAFGYWEIDAEDASGNNLDNTAGWTYDLTLYPPAGALGYLNTNYGSDYYKLLRIPSHSGNSQLTFNSGTADWTGNMLESGDICSGIANISTYSASTGVGAQDLHKFSRFGGGGNSGGAGLPIELLSLEAQPVDNSYIDVKWTTAVEIDNNGFEVMRSTDGINFEVIGWISGNGSTTLQQAYKYSDKNVVPNTLYYYRLNQLDFSGAAKESYIVTASINLENVFVIGEFIPNPTTDNSHITITTSEAKDINVTIFNTLGQVLYVKDQDITSGANRLDFDFSSYAAGTYYAVITVGNERFNKKLVLSK